MIYNLELDDMVSVFPYQVEDLVMPTTRHKDDLPSILYNFYYHSTVCVGLRYVEHQPSTNRVLQLGFLT